MDKLSAFAVLRFTTSSNLELDRQVGRLGAAQNLVNEPNNVSIAE
jgi:hypothetical protein